MVDLGFIKIDASNFIAIIIGIVIFALQMILLFKGKFLIIKLLPILLCAIASVVFIITTFTTEGWDALGWLLLFVFALIYLGVCAFAWVVYGIIKLFTRKKSLE